MLFLFVFFVFFLFVFFFFFQAEDGIRDIGVTGVQTCALPISTVPVICIVVTWVEPVVRMRVGSGQIVESSTGSLCFLPF